MNFSLEYTKEQEEFASEVREWLRKNVPQDIIHVRDPLKMRYEQWQKRRELARKLGEIGWLAPRYPQEYGGGGLDLDHSVVIVKEMEKAGFSLPPYYDAGLSLAAPALTVYGNEEQKKRLLPPILKGEAVTWQVFTEPEAGTDVANQQLRASREKDNFVLNGSKIFVGGLYAPPDQFLLLTLSHPEAPRHQNLAMFLSPANLPGITITPLDLFMPSRLGRVCGSTVDSAPGVKHSVFFDDVIVPEFYLIGGEQDGWKVVSASLNVEHAWGSALERNELVLKLLEQCRSNPSVKRRLLANPQLLESMVNIYIGSYIERLFILRNTWLSNSGKRVRYQGQQLAFYTKTFGLQLINDMAKVLGPYAFVDNDNGWSLDDGIFEVGERCGICVAPGGTLEALKLAMSRALGIGQ